MKKLCFFIAVLIFFLLWGESLFNIKSYVIVENGRNIDGWEAGFKEIDNLESEQTASDTDEVSDEDVKNDSDGALKNSGTTVNNSKIESPVKKEKDNSSVKREKTINENKFQDKKSNTEIELEEEIKKSHDEVLIKSPDQKNKGVAPTEKVTKTENEEKYIKKNDDKNDDDEYSDDEYDIDRETIKKLRKGKLMKSKNRRGL